METDLYKLMQSPQFLTDNHIQAIIYQVKRMTQESVLANFMDYQTATADNITRLRHFMFF